MRRKVENFILLQKGVLEVGAEDMMAVLDAVDNGGALAPASDSARGCCGSICRSAGIDREYRGQTVAHEFQDLSATAVDFLRCTSEQRMKYPDHLITRQPF
jgi:hypothetical protein